MRILIVDDEKPICDGVKRTILSSFPDASILVAGNGKDALDMLSKSPVDIVILDIKMPKMNGLMLLAAGKELDQRIKWIIISAHADFYYAQEALRQGASDYILKPIGKQKLIALITRLHAEMVMEQEKWTAKEQLELEEKALKAAQPVKDADKASTGMIDTAIQYIHEHFHENVSLDKVAAAVYLNPTYFSLLFKQKVGAGYKEYITQLRMEKAKALLRDTPLKVSDIAIQVGFNDMRHFTQVFRKSCQETPTEYRMSESQKTDRTSS
jgi:YesN/AraC family two-component response regulator